MVTRMGVQVNSTEDFPSKAPSEPKVADGVSLSTSSANEKKLQFILVRHKEDPHATSYLLPLEAISTWKDLENILQSIHNGVGSLTLYWEDEDSIVLPSLWNHFLVSGNSFSFIYHEKVLIVVFFAENQHKINFRVSVNATICDLRYQTWSRIKSTPMLNVKWDDPAVPGALKLQVAFGSETFLTDDRVVGDYLLPGNKPLYLVAVSVGWHVPKRTSTVVARPDTAPINLGYIDTFYDRKLNKLYYKFTKVLRAHDTCEHGQVRLSCRICNDDGVSEFRPTPDSTPGKAQVLETPKNDGKVQMPKIMVKASNFNPNAYSSLSSLPDAGGLVHCMNAYMSTATHQINQPAGAVMSHGDASGLTVLRNHEQGSNNLELFSAESGEVVSAPGRPRVRFRSDASYIGTKDIPATATKLTLEPENKFSGESEAMPATEQKPSALVIRGKNYSYIPGNNSGVKLAVEYKAPAYISTVTRTHSVLRDNTEANHAAEQKRTPYLPVDGFRIRSPPNFGIASIYTNGHYKSLADTADATAETPVATSVQTKQNLTESYGAIQTRRHPLHRRSGPISKGLVSQASYQTSPFCFPSREMVAHCEREKIVARCDRTLKELEMASESGPEPQEVSETELARIYFETLDDGLL